jgi:hypothetical protein
MFFSMILASRPWCFFREEADESSVIVALLKQNSLVKLAETIHLIIACGIQTKMCAGD